MSEITVIDVPEALALLRRAVEEKGGDYIDPIALSGATCRYAVSTDEGWTPSCLVGHALIYAGVSADHLALVEYDAPSDWIGGFPFGGEVILTSKAADVLEAAQDAQDNGHTWGEAFARAIACAEDYAEHELTTRKGDWLQTYTGSAFWPLDPRPEDIHPEDIAHALSMLCRFGGHVRKFYSVAEHCVLMSYAVSPENALWALLHDATEAYVVDVPRPVKYSLPMYQEIEAGVAFAISQRFGISIDMPAEVKDADNRILLTERDALLGPSPLAWGYGLDDLEPLDVEIGGWSPPYAKERYSDRLFELLVARTWQSPPPRLTYTMPGSLS